MSVVKLGAVIAAVSVVDASAAVPVEAVLVIDAVKVRRRSISKNLLPTVCIWIIKLTW
jgi:hypothetical protein